MKRALALVLLLVIFVSLVAGMHDFEVAKANFVPSSLIQLVSPTNTTYPSNTVVLNYSAHFVVTQNKLVEYSLDGGANVTLLNQSSSSDGISEFFLGNITLYGLSEGSHHLELYSENIIPGYTEVYFFIESLATPTPMPTPEPTPTPSEETTPLPTINTGPSSYYFDDFLIGGIAATVAIIVLVLLYYFTRRE